MITKTMKLIGALLVILEDRRGPPFFVCHRLDVKNKQKSKGIRISLYTNSFCNFNFYTYVPYKSNSAHVLFLKMPVFLHFEI